MVLVQYDATSLLGFPAVTDFWVKQFGENARKVLFNDFVDAFDGFVEETQPAIMLNVFMKNITPKMKEAFCPKPDDNDVTVRELKQLFRDVQHHDDFVGVFCEGLKMPLPEGYIQPGGGIVNIVSNSTLEAFHGLNVNSAYNELHGLTSCGNKLYCVDGKSLYEVDPATGNYIPRLGTMGNSVYGDLHGLTSCGNKLYCVDGNSLYEIDPYTGDYIPRLGTMQNAAYSAMQGLTSCGNKLYCIDGGILYEVDPGTGDYIPRRSSLGNAVYNAVQGLTSCGSKLYCVDNRVLYEVDPGTGDFIARLGTMQNAAYSEMHGFTSCGNKLYCVDGKIMYEVDPATGDYIARMGK